MTKKWVVLVVFALVAAGPAQAGWNDVQRDVIRVNVEAPVFLGPTPACPALRVHTLLVSDAGAVIGSSILCASSAVFDEETATYTEVGTLALHLAGGEILARVIIDDDFSVYPVVQTISGTVTRSNGVYRGATGTVSGGGTIVFDADGVPHPDSTIIVDFD